MKFFKKSKQELEKFKSHVKVFYFEFRSMQSEYFKLLLRKEKSEEEKSRFKDLKKENFRLSIFLMCTVAPIPFIVTSYFIFVPRRFWPNTLKKILNLKD